MLAAKPIIQPRERIVLHDTRKSGLTGLCRRFLSRIFSSFAKFVIASGVQTVSGASFPGVSNGQWITRLYFAVTPTGNYPTGGDTLNLQNVSPLVVSGYIPVFVAIEGDNGFVYEYVNGTTQANGKMKVFTGAAAQSALTELSAGAYPAGVTTDVITGYADFVEA